MNDNRRYVIVGNGFAGTTCAEQLRKADSSCSIALFTDEPYTLYNRIALPPLLRKQVTEAKVIMRDLAWHEKHAIDLHLSTRVERIDATEKVAYANGTGYPFDALLVATGGRPNPSLSPGVAGAYNVFNFQYMDDTKAISRQLEESKVAVAIGGSFIAYELAEAFASRGVETHWLLRGPRFLRRMLDEIAGEMVDDAARIDGVHVHYGEELDHAVRSNGVVTKVVTSSGIEIPCDCLGVGLGLTINTDSYNSPVMHYRRCDRNGCYVEMAVDNAMVESLAKSGPQGKLTITADNGKTYGLAISFKGFAAAHDEMVSQARAKAKPVSKTADAPAPTPGATP